MAGETLRERVARAGYAEYERGYGDSDTWPTMLARIADGDPMDEAGIRDNWLSVADVALAVVAEDVDGIAEVLRAHFLFALSFGWYCADDDCDWSILFDDRHGYPDPQESFAIHQAAVLAAHFGAQP